MILRDTGRHFFFILLLIAGVVAPVSWAAPVTVAYGAAPIQLEAAEGHYLLLPERGAGQKAAAPDLAAAGFAFQEIPDTGGAVLLRATHKSATPPAMGERLCAVSGVDGAPPTLTAFVGITHRVSLRLRPGIDAAAFFNAHGLRAPRALGWGEHWTASVDGPPGSALATSERLAALPEVDWAAPILVRPQAGRFVPNDILFSDQWNLKNDGDMPLGIAGEDANFVPAWDLYTGAGVNIGIVDIGFELTHEDFVGRFNTQLNIDVWDEDLDPSPNPGVAHGTCVAGIAGATCNNTIGVCGAAFGAKLAGIRYLFSVETDDVLANALTHTITATETAEQVHIFNNSFGPIDDGVTLAAPGPLTAAALEAGTTVGRNGKGAIYIWAGGNGSSALDEINYDGFAASIYVIAVSASTGRGEVSGISEPGPALMVNAPSGYSAAGLTTTTVNNNYTQVFGGTSGAAPLVSSVVALMLEANPELTWRDVQHVLINSATKNDPTAPEWFTNAAGFDYNRNHGFGRVDAEAAAILAESWESVPPWATPLSAEGSPNLSVPDNDPTGVTHTLDIAAPPGFVTERVLVRLSATHTFRGDLKWTLSSPQGTTVVLANGRPDGGADYIDWPMTSLATWGEDPNGTWTMKVEDIGPQDTGIWTDWELVVYGYLPATEGEGEGESPQHSADQDGNYVISLSELLRVIQFYNSLALHCELGTEDGFAPGTGDTSCAPHQSDYAPQDWVISLSELLRLIQFYNSLGYTPCPDGEDGYCPPA